MISPGIQSASKLKRVDELANGEQFVRLVLECTCLHRDVDHVQQASWGVMI